MTSKVAIVHDINAGRVAGIISPVLEEAGFRVVSICGSDVFKQKGNPNFDPLRSAMLRCNPDDDIIFLTSSMKNDVFIHQGDDIMDIAYMEGLPVVMYSTVDLGYIRYVNPDSELYQYKEVEFDKVELLKCIERAFRKTKGEDFQLNKLASENNINEIDRA